MPRPLNWVRGEGTTKNQRGLATGEIQVSNDPTGDFLATQNVGNNDWVLPACSDITTQAGFVGPINCDPTNGGVNYTPGTAPNVSRVGNTISLTTIVLIGVGLILVLKR